MNKVIKIIEFLLIKEEIFNKQISKSLKINKKILIIKINKTLLIKINKILLINHQSNKSPVKMIN